MILREYATQSPATIANLQREPANRTGAFGAVEGIHVLLASPLTEIESLAPIYAAAASINMRIIPGFRLMETTPAGGWADVDRWMRNADLVVRLKARYPSITHLTFDTEGYSHTQPTPPTAPAFAAAIEPFLDAIRTTEIIPSVYPTNLTGIGIEGLVTAAIADLGIAGTELWTETGFELPELARTDPLKADRLEAKVERIEAAVALRWPHASCRHGLFEDVLRVYGAPMRARLSNWVGNKFWIFDNDRARRQHMTERGSTAWINDTNDPANDVAHCWRFAPFGEGPPISLPGGLALTRYNFPNVVNASPDLRSVNGMLIPSGRAYYANGALPRSGSLTMLAEITVPLSGSGPIFGADVHNAEGWHVGYEAGVLALHVRQRTAPSGRASIAIVDASQLGASIRVLVSLSEAGEWRVRFGTPPVKADDPWIIGSPVSFTPPVKVGPGAGMLWLGGGTALLGQRRQVPFVGGGLVFANVETWPRQLSDTEEVAALATPYPR